MRTGDLTETDLCNGLVLEVGAHPAQSPEARNPQEVLKQKHVIFYPSFNHNPYTIYTLFNTKTV